MAKAKYIINGKNELVNSANHKNVIYRHLTETGLAAVKWAGTGKKLTEDNWSDCGGVLGMIITLTVMLGIKGLSPSVSISVILIAQLTGAVLIDLFGLFDSQKIAPSWTQLAGALLMVGGIILYKWKVK